MADLANIEAAVGKLAMRQMADILELPEELRDAAEALTEFKTVDGHVWIVRMEYSGFEGPDQLRQSPGDTQ